MEKNKLGEVTKSLIVAVVVAGAGSFINVNVLTSEMTTVKDQIKKLDTKVDRIDNQVRAVEIKQAELNTVISNRQFLVRN